MTKSNYKKILKLSIQRRGEILERFTYIEMIMDNIIARHFCANTDKTNELTAVLLSKIDFSKKKEVIFYIMDCNKIFLDKHKTIKKDLEKLNSTRNIFAHRYLAILDDHLKTGKLSYMQFDKGKQTEIEISKEYFDDKISLLVKCEQAISELDDIVRTWPLPKKSKRKNNEE